MSDDEALKLEPGDVVTRKFQVGPYHSGEFELGIVLGASKPPSWNCVCVRARWPNCRTPRQDGAHHVERVEMFG